METSARGDIVPEVGITSTPVIESSQQNDFIRGQDQEVSGVVTAMFTGSMRWTLALAREKFGGPAEIARQS